jgi:hypothetical protein
MNVGRYLRGEDRHIGTARTTQPHPPQRTWVGLTKKEILLVNEKQDESIIAAPDNELIQFSRAIEAKLKEKNT